MVKPLRKYHFLLWRLLAIALPLGFVFAILERPGYTSHKNGEHIHPFLFEAKTLADSSLRITVLVTEPITSPAAVLYAEIKNQKYLLGKFDRQGSYVFTLPKMKELTKEIIVNIHDPIRDKEISNSRLHITNPYETQR